MENYTVRTATTLFSLGQNGCEQKPRINVRKLPFGDSMLALLLDRDAVNAFAIDLVDTHRVIRPVLHVNSHAHVNIAGRTYTDRRTPFSD